MAVLIASIPLSLASFLLPETDASDRASAACYRSIENVRIVAVIVAKFELSHVQRQIFFADLVIAADDAAFDQRPKTLNRLRMHCADNVFLRAMADDAVGKIASQIAIAGMFVSGEQTDFVTILLREQNRRASRCPCSQ